MAYATVEQVEAGFRTLTTDEETICTALLDEAAVIIDAYCGASDDSDPYSDDDLADAKQVVSCRMVRRAIGAGDASVPVGATQGTMTAGPYSQSWTMSSGSTGELYLGRVDKKILGVGNALGTSNPYRQAGLVGGR